MLPSSGSIARRNRGQGIVDIVCQSRTVSLAEALQAMDMGGSARIGVLKVKTKTKELIMAAKKKAAKKSVKKAAKKAVKKTVKKVAAKKKVVKKAAKKAAKKTVKKTARKPFAKKAVSVARTSVNVFREVVQDATAALAAPAKKRGRR